MSLKTFFSRADKSQLPVAEQALPGRDEVMSVDGPHYVLNTSMVAPYPEGMEQAMFGMGCFWGAERLFWQQEGVYTTAVAYAAGFTKNPHYEEVCTGQTGHNEVVVVVFDPLVVSYEQLLRLFWEGHNPSQGMQQGNDVGTQYRSGIYTFSAAQQRAADESKVQYGVLMSQEGLVAPTTEVLEVEQLHSTIHEGKAFYYAEFYHQQYLAKNPGGYCGLVPIEQSGRPRFPVDR